MVYISGNTSESYVEEVVLKNISGLNIFYIAIYYFINT